MSQLDHNVLELRSVDDVFVVASEIDGVGRSRSSLSRLEGDLDIEPAIDAIGCLREVAPAGSVDVVGSFLGRRNFNRYDIEDAAAASLSRRGWSYRSRRGGRAPPDTDVSLRVHIAGERATIGVRVSPHPLHRRNYRVRRYPGSLHPPLAFAMTMLASGSVGADPCCGSGTIPIEGSAGGSWIACDADPDAVAVTRTNAARAGVAIRVVVADAGRLPLRDGSVERVVTNVPWGRATRPVGGLTESLTREIARVLVEGGQAVLLGVAPRATAPLEVREHLRVAASGAWTDLLVARLA